jgi:thiamine biosynthesis protein ThiS
MAEPVTSIAIIVNGESREVPADLTLRGLLDLLEVKGPHVAVARNTELVPRSEFDAIRLASGDEIEIVHAIGGGAM